MDPTGTMNKENRNDSKSPSKGKNFSLTRKSVGGGSTGILKASTIQQHNEQYNHATNHQYESHHKKPKLNEGSNVSNKRHSQSNKRVSFGVVHLREFHHDTEPVGNHHTVDLEVQDMKFDNSREMENENEKSDESIQMNPDDENRSTTSRTIDDENHQPDQHDDEDDHDSAITFNITTPAAASSTASSTYHDSNGFRVDVIPSPQYVDDSDDDEEGNEKQIVNNNPTSVNDDDEDTDEHITFNTDTDTTSLSISTRPSLSTGLVASPIQYRASTTNNQVHQLNHSTTSTYDDTQQYTPSSGVKSSATTGAASTGTTTTTTTTSNVQRNISLMDLLRQWKDQVSPTPATSTQKRISNSNNPQHETNLNQRISVGMDLTTALGSITYHQTPTTTTDSMNLSAAAEEGSETDMEMTGNVGVGIVTRRVSTMPMNIQMSAASTAATVNHLHANHQDTSVVDDEDKQEISSNYNNSHHDSAHNNIRRMTAGMDMTQSLGRILQSHHRTPLASLPTARPSVSMEFTRAFGGIQSQRLSHANDLNNTSVSMEMTRAVGGVLAVPSTPSYHHQPLNINTYAHQQLFHRLSTNGSLSRFPPKSPATSNTSFLNVSLSLMSPPTVSGHHGVHPTHLDTRAITFPLGSMTAAASNAENTENPSHTALGGGVNHHHNSALSSNTALTGLTAVAHSPFTRSAKTLRTPVSGGKTLSRTTVLSSTATATPPSCSNHVNTNPSSVQMQQPPQALTVVPAEEEDDNMEMTINMGSILSRRISTLPASLLLPTTNPTAVAGSRRDTTSNDMDLTTAVGTIVSTANDSIPSKASNNSNTSTTSTDIPPFLSPHADRRRTSGRLTRRFSGRPSHTNHSHRPSLNHPLTGIDATERLRQRMALILEGDVRDKTMDLPRRELMSEQTTQVALLMEQILAGEVDQSILETHVNRDQQVGEEVDDRQVDTDMDGEVKHSTTLSSPVYRPRMSRSNLQHSHALVEESEVENDDLVDPVPPDTHIPPTPSSSSQSTLPPSSQPLSQSQPPPPLSQSSSSLSSTHQHLQFAEFLKLTGIDVLDERSDAHAQETLKRRDSAMNHQNLVDLTSHIVNSSASGEEDVNDSEWPPSTLNGLIECGMIEGTELEDLQAACLNLLDSKSDLEENIQNLESYVNTHPIHLFQQIQSMNSSALHRIKKHINLLRHRCKQEGKAAWYEWRMNLAKLCQSHLLEHVSGIQKDINALNELYHMMQQVKDMTEQLVDTRQVIKRNELYTHLTAIQEAQSELQRLQQVQDGFNHTVQELEQQQQALQVEVETLKSDVVVQADSRDQLVALEDEYSITGNLLDWVVESDEQEKLLIMKWCSTYQLTIQFTENHMVLGQPTVSPIHWDHPLIQSLLYAAQPILQPILQTCKTRMDVPLLAQQVHLLLTHLYDPIREIEELRKHYTVKTQVMKQGVPVVSVTFTHLSTMQQLIVPFQLTSQYPYCSLLPTSSASSKGGEKEASSSSSGITIIAPLKPRFTVQQVYEVVNRTEGFGRLTKICQQLHQLVTTS